MDVTLPIGVATVSGMPPAGGVPDVLAQLAGADATLARDPFAALLAALGLGGVEPPGIDTAEADVEADVSTEPAPAATQAAALLLQPAPLASEVTRGEGTGAPSPVTPPDAPEAGAQRFSEASCSTLAAVSGADAPLSDASGAGAQVMGAYGDRSAPAALTPNETATPGGRVEGPAVAVDARTVVAANSAASDATPSAPVLLAPAEAGGAAPVTPRNAQRAATGDETAVTAASAEQGTAGDDSRPAFAAAETVTDGQLAGRDAAEPQVNATNPVPTRTQEENPRPRDAAPLADPEQPTDAPRVPLVAAEPATTLRRREAAPTPAAEPAVDARHSATADAMPSTPRPAHAQTAPSDATAAYRHAEAATMPELPRPLGRLPDGGEMRLEVTPEGLGPIEIRVAVRADAVQASMWTQQDHARAALEAHRPMLADALGRSSLRLEEFTVGVGQHHHAAQDDDRTPRRWANPLAAEPVAAPSSSNTPVRTRGLSLRA